MDGEVMAEQSERRINCGADLIFNTDTSESGYPIYLVEDNTIVLRKKPGKTVKAVFYVKEIKVIEEDVLDSLYEKNYGVDIYGDDEKAREIVKGRIEKLNISHPLIENVRRAFTDVCRGLEHVGRYSSQKYPYEYRHVKVVYEVYRGEMDVFIGEYIGYFLMFTSKSTPYSGSRGETKRAFAIGYDWVKRIKSKYPEIAEYIYLKSEEARKGINVHIVAKLPIPTVELDEIVRKLIGEEKPIEKGIEVKVEPLNELKYWMNRCSELEIKISELNERIRELERERGKLNDKITLLESERKNLLEKISELEEQIKELEKKLKYSSRVAGVI